MLCSVRLAALLRSQRKDFQNFNKNSRLFSCAVLCLASNMEEDNVMELVKQAIPPLVESKYKGQAGRIGVVGGSKE